MDKRKRYKPRAMKLIGFKAFRDTDRDIIAWWESLPPGQGSEVLRALIRDHMTATGDDNVLVREMEALRVDMSAQFRALSQQLRQMNGAAPAAPIVEPESRLSEAEIAERKRAILKQRW